MWLASRRSTPLDTSLNALYFFFLHLRLMSGHADRAGEGKKGSWASNNTGIRATTLAAAEMQLWPLRPAIARLGCAVANRPISGLILRVVVEEGVEM